LRGPAQELRALPVPVRAARLELLAPAALAEQQAALEPQALEAMALA
jgi:hypothetical protein